MKRRCLQLCIGHGKSFKTRHREQVIDKNSLLTGTRTGTDTVSWPLAWESADRSRTPLRMVIEAQVPIGISGRATYRWKEEEKLWLMVQSAVWYLEMVAKLVKFPWWSKWGPLACESHFFGWMPTTNLRIDMPGLVYGTWLVRVNCLACMICG